MRHPRRGWTSRLLGGALGFALAAGLSAHAGMFAGVTDIRIEPDRQDRLSIRFQSDLPFEYDLRVLDADTVVVKLINARLAGSLIAPDGRLKLHLGQNDAHTAIHSARLAVDSLNGEESLILEGPGLGRQVLTVSGATAVALTQPRQPDPATIQPEKPPTGNKETITLPDFKALAPEKGAAPIRLDTPQSGTAPLSDENINTGNMKELLQLGNLKRLGQAGIQAGLAQRLPTTAQTTPADVHPTAGPTIVPGAAEASLTPLSQAELPDAEEAFLALLKADEEPDFVPRLSTEPVKPEQQLQTIIGDTREEVLSQHRPSATSRASAVQTLDPFSEKYDPAVALRNQNPTGPQISAIKSIPYIPGQGRTIDMPGTPAYTAQTQTYAAPPGYYYPPPYYYPPQEDPQQMAYSEPAEVYPPEEAIAPQQPLLKPVPRYRGEASPIQYSVAGTEQVYTLPPGQVNADYNLDNVGDDAIAALSFDPATAEESAEAHMYQALSHYRRQNYDRALEMVEQAVLMDPDNPNIQAALAEIQIKLDHPKQAIEAYEKALKHAEKPALKEKYLGRYAVALYLRGDRKKAVDTLELLLKEKDGLAANQYVIHFILGTLYQELGMMEQAIARLQSAAKLNPGSPDVQFGLGLTYELSGNVAAAKVHYAKALKLKPGSSDIAMALERVKG